MNRLMMIVLSLAAGAVFAGQPEAWRNGERVPLWPEGKIPDFQPQQVGAMTDEAETNAEWRAAHRMPYLEWFEAPAKPNGGCMILVSGGGYGRCCDVGLIKFWRDELTKDGFQCVNLVYRTPRPQGLPVHQSAWEDGQRAVRLVRGDAKKRGFSSEKIGIIGMSAGGHLVCLLAANSQTPSYAPVDEVDKISCHVNWAIPNAPAYNTANGETGNQTREDGLTIVPKISPCFQFDAKTPPMCFHHGGMDPWSPNGSTLMYRELRKRHIPAELHLYADKPHGAHGFERALEFIRQMNFDGKLDKNEVAQGLRFFPGRTIRTEKEMLWPKGKTPGGDIGRPCEPYLVWYIPEQLKTKAIQVIVPGGGYSICNFNGEGTPVAHYLNGKGMTAVVVMYRCLSPAGKPKHQVAWEDAQRAIRKVRSEATMRGLDPDRIGLMGFSAGGHLTLMTATNGRTPAYEPVDEIDKLPCTLQWACPIYPAYSLTDGAFGVNKNGGNLDEDVLVPEFAFDDATPPMCFVHGDGDAFSAMASVKAWEKLRAMGVQSDLHTLARRGHCFQFNAARDTGSFTWMDRIWEFLGRKGLNK